MDFWASQTILYSLSSLGHFIIASPKDSEGLIEVITLISISFLSQICLGFPCWALLASEWQWNQLLSYPLHSLWWGVVTPTHYTWAFIQYCGISVSAKRFLFAVWVVGFPRWEEYSPATKQTDAEILQNSLSVQPNIWTSKLTRYLEARGKAIWFRACLQTKIFSSPLQNTYLHIFSCLSSSRLHLKGVGMFKASG